MSRPLGAELSHMLKARGVTHVFGIPGVHNQELYRGIEEAGLTHILARHEGGAGFMADGYARASGRPGVAYVITGPGLTNILTPLGQAYSDSVPVLTIASCLDQTAGRRGQLHQMRDQSLAAATVSDWSEEARSAEEAFALIDRALVEFETQRARPKTVHAAIALLEGLAPAAPAPPMPPTPPRADPGAAGVIATQLGQARRPLMIFGGGSVGADTAMLAQVSGAACFTTYAGRGTVPDHPLNFGAFLARPGSVEILAGADLIVVFGAELTEVDLWRDQLGHTAPMIRVDRDPQVLADMRRAEVPIMADCRAVIASLCAQLSDGPLQTDWTVEEVRQARAKWRAEVAAERPGILPVSDALSQALPPDTMIYSDMTTLAYGAKEVWDMPRPGHWHHPTGFGTLGYALPAAIGGAVARPGLPTMAIIGDYGFQYTVQELATAVELGLPLPILVWDNDKLGEIEASMVRAQIAPNAVRVRNPDFCALGRAYGAAAVQPRSLDDLAAAILTAFQADRPTLIHARAEDFV